MQQRFIRLGMGKHRSVIYEEPGDLPPGIPPDFGERNFGATRDFRLLGGAPEAPIVAQSPMLTVVLSALNITGSHTFA